MHPVRFVREHPVGFIGSAVFGMIAGPWAMGIITRYTGVSVGLPSFRGVSVRED
jgi:formylmethanofuran dehydrogenase subunit D